MAYDRSLTIDNVVARYLVNIVACNGIRDVHIDAFLMRFRLARLLETLSFHYQAVLFVVNSFAGEMLDQLSSDTRLLLWLRRDQRLPKCDTAIGLTRF